MSINDKKQLSAKLFEAIREGNSYAFAAYYTGFVDPLVYFLRKIVGDEEDAREIAQDVFVQLWETRDQIQPDKQLDSFVYTIARNMALKVLRKRETHSRFYDEQLYIQDDEGISADEILISKETEELLNDVQNSMPPQRRMAFQLSRNEGLSYEEIATRMGLSVDTVKTHIRLALKDIREAMLLFSMCLSFLMTL